MTMRAMGRLPNGLRITDYDAGVVGFPLCPDWHKVRWATIESEQASVTDPWQHASEKPFHLSPSELLLRAANNPPLKPGNTVSAFTGWLYSLYTGPRDPSSLMKGQEAERDIAMTRSKIISHPKFARINSKAWSLVHSGLHDDTENGKSIVVFEVPALQIGGEPLRACPDLVFKKKSDDQVLIVEIKFSTREVPTNLWPNVWGQLWAYSKIPHYAAAPRINLIGEVWGENDGWQYIETLHSLVYLRRSVRRDPRTPAFERFFRRLFELYGGSLKYSSVVGGSA
jgi:hypothetical protein